MSEIVIAFIVVLALVGVAFQLWALRGYATELEHLKRAEIAEKGMDYSEGIGVLISRASLSDQTIVGHRHVQVGDIAKSPAPPSSADLSAADFERDDAQLKSVFPNTLISILLIIGLAGTLISFSQIFRDIPTENKTTEEIKAWINKAYPAFGTAFLASLCGIGGTVFLLVVRSFVHNRRAELFDRLDRFTAARLYHRFVERQWTDEATLNLAGRRLLECAASFDTSVAKLVDVPVAITSAATGIESAANETRAALHAAQATFAEFQTAFAPGGAVKDSLERVEGVVANFGRQTESAAGNLREAVSGAATALAGTAGAVRQAGDSIAATVQGLAQGNAQLLAGNGTHLTKMEALVGSLGGTVDAASRNQREWSEAISPAIRAMAESAARMEQSVALLNHRTDVLANTAEQIEKSTAQTVSMGDAQVERFKTSADRIEHAITQTTDSQRAFVEKLMAHLNLAADGQSGRLEAVAEKLDRNAGQIAVGQRTLLSGLEQGLQAMPRQILSLAEQQTRLLGQLQKVGGELKEAIVSAGIRIPVAKRGILDRIAFWKKWKK